MKIAITADNHIIDNETHPERLITFGNLLNQCGDLGVDLLVVCGDMFDKQINNFADFEQVFRAHCPKDLQTIVLPGNHDPRLNQGMFSISSFEVISKPQTRELDHGLSALFIPYKPETTMGEAISAFRENVDPGSWVLISHGDWTEGLGLSNSYEEGGYMPLSRSDVQYAKPIKVFLGHIHLPYDGDPVYYPGSPCPINVNEAGLRRMLVFDTETKKVNPVLVETPKIYYNERFIVLPDENGIDRLRQQMEARISEWECPNEWQDRVIVRVRIQGFSPDLQAVKETATEAFSSFVFYDSEGPILKDVNYADDLDRAHITEEVKSWIDNLDWPNEPPEPEKDNILIKALSFIYGV
jgi:DNA repair protein SbcD/Mre11